MAGPRVSQSSGHSRWKQWWRRSPNTCCSKRILLLLVWEVLFAFSLRLFPGSGLIVLPYSSPNLTSARKPIKGARSDERIAKSQPINGARKFGELYGRTINPLPGNNLKEKANSTSHTSNNSILLLQQVLGDLLHHCFQRL